MDTSAVAAGIDLWAGVPAAVMDRALPVLESGRDTEEPAMLAPLLVLAARAAADLRAAQVALREGQGAVAARLLKRAATDAREHVPLLAAIRATTG